MEVHWPLANNKNHTKTKTNQILYIKIKKRWQFGFSIFLFLFSLSLYKRLIILVCDRLPVGNHFHRQCSSVCIVVHRRLSMWLFHGRPRMLGYPCQLSWVRHVQIVKHHHLFRNYKKIENTIICRICANIRWIIFRCYKQIL